MGPSRVRATVAEGDEMDPAHSDAVTMLNLARHPGPRVEATLR